MVCRVACASTGTLGGGIILDTCPTVHHHRATASGIPTCVIPAGTLLAGAVPHGTPTRAGAFLAEFSPEAILACAHGLVRASEPRHIHASEAIDRGCARVVIEPGFLKIGGQIIWALQFELVLQIPERVLRCLYP
jgi:hypothetical protein